MKVPKTTYFVFRKKTYFVCLMGPISVSGATHGHVSYNNKRRSVSSGPTFFRPF